MIDNCILPWYKMSINKYETYLCCRASMKSYCGKHHLLNNTINYDLNKIWNSNIYQNIRKSMSEDGVFEACFSSYQPQEFSRCVPTQYIPIFTPKRLIQQHQFDNMEKTKNNYLSKKTVLDNYPAILEMTTDFECNSRCVMCVQKDKHRNYKEWVVPVDKIRDSLEEFLYYATSFILLGGEPTISSNYHLLLDIVRHANGAKIYLVSNGQLIEKEILPYMDLMGYFHISGDAATEETYSKIRIGLDFKKFINGFKKLVKAKEDRTIFVNHVIHKINYKEMPDMAMLWYDLGADFMIFDEAWIDPSRENIIGINTIDEKNDLKKYLMKTIELCEDKKIPMHYSFPMFNLQGTLNR